jgi:hypothetical protein
VKDVRWGWVVLGGFLAELGIFLVAIPLSLLLGPASLLYSAPVASFAMTFLFGFWVARKAPAHFVANGTLVGIVAVLLYVVISQGQPVPWAYVVAHVLKVFGGALGGLVVHKRASGAATMAAA